MASLASFWRQVGGRDSIRAAGRTNYGRFFPAEIRWRLLPRRTSLPFFPKSSQWFAPEVTLSRKPCDQPAAR